METKEVNLKIEDGMQIWKFKEDGKIVSFHGKKLHTGFWDKLGIREIK